MINSKKGIFFTLVSILIVSVFVLSFKPESYVTLENKVPVVGTQISITNDLVKSINTAYLDTTLYMTSRNSLLGILDYMGNPGYAFGSRDQFDASFKQVLLQGKIGGYPISLMDQNTFVDKLTLLEEKVYESMNINLKFLKQPGEINVSIFQSNLTGPWQVGVNVNISYSIDTGIAQWNVTTYAETRISIIGFYDPVYQVNHKHGSRPEYPRKINNTNVSFWNLAALQNLMGNKTYRADGNATSFLQRFYNNYEPSECCGIETFVTRDIIDRYYDPPPLLSPLNSRSYVDCAFYGNRCASGSLYSIAGITDTAGGYPFVLDFYHVVRYNVSDYIQ